MAPWPNIFLMLVTLQGTLHCILADQVIVEATEYEDIDELLGDIAESQKVRCGFVIVSDASFTHHALKWMTYLQHPYVTLNLDDDPKYIRSLNNSVAWDSSGYVSCTYIVLCCRTVATCRTKYSQLLYKTVDAARIIRPVRRAFIYVHDEIANTMKTPNLDDKKFPILRQSTTFIKELSPHISLIRRVEDNLSDGSNSYKIVTYTPNWLPGGSPVLSTMWSQKRSFHHPKNLLMTWKDIRRGGNMRIGLPNSKLLPLIHVDNNGTGSGIDHELVEIVSRRFKINVKYMEAEDNRFGEQYKNGRWSGVMGMVLKKDVDVGMGILRFTYKRLRTGVQFSKAIGILKACAICPAPKIVFDWTDVITPFDNEVWGSIFLSLAAYILISSLLQRALKRLFVPRKPRKPPMIFWRRGYQPPKKSWFPWPYLVGPILQKSIPLTIAPKRLSYRIFFGFWGITSFLISSFYAGTLMSKFSVPAKSDPPETMDEMIAQTKDWILGALVYRTIKDTTFEREKMLMNRSFDTGSAVGGSDDMREFHYVAKTGNCALMARARAKYVIEHNFTSNDGGEKIRSIRWSQEYLTLGPAGWILRSDVDFVFLRYVDKTMLALQASGILQKVENSYAPENTYLRKAEEEVATREAALGLDTLFVVFIIWGLGLVLSTIVFWLELGVYAGMAIKRRGHKGLGG